MGAISSYNLYAYCQNAPTNHMDQDGKDMITVDGCGGGSLMMQGAGHATFAPSFAGNASASWSAAKWLTYLWAPVSTWLGTIVEKNSSKDVAEELPDIAGHYGNLQCVEAKNAMVDYLTQKKKHGNIIKLYFGNGSWFVWSITYNREISRNATHYGVEYENIVYCNVHPYRLPKDEWITDFISSNPFPQISIIPF